HRHNSRGWSRYGIEPRIAFQSATGGYPLLAHYMATDSDRLVADCDSHGCDRSVGSLFPVGEMFAEFRVVVLFFGGYLPHYRIRRSCVAERMAYARPYRGLHRNSDVRPFHRIFLYRCEQKRSSPQGRKEPGLTV